MNLLPLRTEVYIDYDDISIIMQMPNPDSRRIKLDNAEQNLNERCRQIIENARAENKYYNIAGRDEAVRGIIIMKSGIVIGINNNPVTIIKKLKTESRNKKTADKKTQGGRTK